jgi:putative ABC transport system permease protein
LQRAQALPGVELAAITRAADLPPGQFHATNTFDIEGRVQPLGAVQPIARYPVVSAGYFGIMGIRLLQGRLPEDSASGDAPPVVIVNQALARRYFANEDPIGKRVRTGGGDTPPWRTIIGIVEDVKASGLAAAAEPAVYLPHRQGSSIGDLGLVLRSPLDAGTIATELRKAVADLDPNQPVASVQAMDDRLNESVSGPRFTTVLLFAFAAVAIVLGWIGVYGVMGCRVRWQLRELAVRQALGAQRNDVIRHVLLQGAIIVLPGVIAGLAGALWLSRLLSSMLYEVPPRDPLTFAAVSSGLVAVALLACWIPAARAARSDPLQFLRHD